MPLRRIAFILNPIAGMGGSVGLKGTDGVLTEALARGGTPHALPRAVQCLRALMTAEAGSATLRAVQWIAPEAPMGMDALEEAGIAEDRCSILLVPQVPCSAADTRQAARAAVAAGVDLILFCGGDGTARDLLAEVGSTVPILGVPAGVKMHSGVFAVTPFGAARVVTAFVEGQVAAGEAEVLDLDEDAYRRGEWTIRLHGVARCPMDPSLVACGKLNVEEKTDDEMKREIALYLADRVRETGGLAVLGPGSTMAAVGQALGIPKTLLGIDVLRDGALVKADATEADLLGLLEPAAGATLYLSPLGAQGFLLGRGNLPLTPRVITRIGIERIVVAATPAKLEATPTLRVDTGDAALDGAFAAKGYLAVVIGDLLSRMVPLAQPAGGP